MYDLTKKGKPFLWEKRATGNLQGNKEKNVKTSSSENAQ